MAKEKSPAYQRYPADYLSDENVAAMTLEQEGAYNRLMDHCWMEGSIPSDTRRMKSLCKNISERKMIKIWNVIKTCFQTHPTDPTRLVHPRVEKERTKRHAYLQTSSENGKRGAEARWGGHRVPYSQAMNPPLAENDSSSSFLSSSSLTDKESSPSGEPKKKVASRGARIPDDWLPNDAHRAIAKERGVDLATECVKMRDWAASKGITRKDWDATFRNWLRNAKPEIRPAVRVNEMPQSAAPRDGQLRHPITEVDPLLEQQRLEQTRVDAWAKANTERAELLWAEVQDEAVAKGVTRGGEKLARGYMESRFRRRVVDEILTPKLARA